METHEFTRVVKTPYRIEWEELWGAFIYVLVYKRKNKNPDRFLVKKKYFNRLGSKRDLIRIPFEHQYKAITEEYFKRYSEGDWNLCWRIPTDKLAIEEAVKLKDVPLLVQFYKLSQEGYLYYDGKPLNRPFQIVFYDHLILSRVEDRLKKSKKVKKIVSKSTYDGDPKIEAMYLPSQIEFNKWRKHKGNYSWVSEMKSSVLLQFSEGLSAE